MISNHTISWLGIWLLVAINVAGQQKSYPAISPPLDIPLTLSGTFCELRNTHFHAGLDLRTEGREGLNVYAVDDGYVVRIRISATGYGKALYINHPNGYTSVYGHLQEFNGAIAQLARQIQYEQQSFEIDTLLPAHLLPVSRGQLIARSGNTGSSQAPHLHFEMRETITEAPVNPKLFGLFIIDNIAPVPADLFLYNLEKKSLSTSTIKLKLINKGKFYGLVFDTVVLNTTQLGVALHVNDRMEDSDNSNGIYELTMKVNDRPAFHFQFNQLSTFDDVRYALAHMDHALNKTQGIRAHRCFRLPGNYLNIYHTTAGNGIIALRHGETKKLEIIVSDLCKNSARVMFYVQCDTSRVFFKKTARNFSQLLSCQQPHLIDREDIKLYFPDSTFYEDIYFTYEKLDPWPHTKVFSSLHQVHTDLDPCHRAFDISIKSLNFPDALRAKALLVRENHKGNRVPLLGTWFDDFFSSRSKEFGRFYLSIDTTPPLISPINIYPNKWMKDIARVRFKISDNLAGIHSFDMYIDGNWVLAEYDAKSNLVWHDFDQHLEPGAHEIVFIVRDNLSNIASYVTRFRK